MEDNNIMVTDGGDKKPERSLHDLAVHKLYQLVNKGDFGAITFVLSNPLFRRVSLTEAARGTYHEEDVRKATS